MQNNERASERWQALQPADPLSSGSIRPAAGRDARPTKTSAISAALL